MATKENKIDGSTIMDSVIVKEEVQEDIFETLFKDTDKEIKILNVHGGCVMNTYINGNAASVFIPGNHIKNGKLERM